jgi:hypothetical protein
MQAMELASTLELGSGVLQSHANLLQDALVDKGEFLWSDGSTVFLHHVDKNRIIHQGSNEDIRTYCVAQAGSTTGSRWVCVVSSLRPTAGQPERLSALSVYRVTALEVSHVARVFFKTTLKGVKMMCLSHSSMLLLVHGATRLFLCTLGTAQVPKLGRGADLICDNSKVFDATWQLDCVWSLASGSMLAVDWVRRGVTNSTTSLGVATSLGLGTLAVYTWELDGSGAQPAWEHPVLAECLLGAKLMSLHAAKDAWVPRHSCCYHHNPHLKP